MKLTAEEQAALAGQQAYAEAVGHLRKALELSPDAQRLRPPLIEALLHAGQVDAARQEAALFVNRGGQLPAELSAALKAADRSQ